MTGRARIPDNVQHRILDRSRRRCALCIHFNNDWHQKQGQLAHLDRDPSNFAEDNLAFFCLSHHDDYDTRRRQTKNLTIREAKTARDRLYTFIEKGGDLASAGQQTLPAAQAGIRLVGGSMRNVLIEGFPTGIEGIDTTIDSATVRRHQFSGADFSKDGRFSTLTNAELKEEAGQLSAQLLSLRTAYEQQCGPKLANIDEATSWVNKEFTNRYREVTAQLAGEILSRIDRVVVDKMSPISYGGHVVYTGKLDGMEPLLFASYFLEHIAEKLRDLP